MPSDIDLLALETDTLWTRDDRGRLARAGGLDAAPPPQLVVAASSAAQIAAVGHDVPNELAAELLSVVVGAAPPAPGQPPAALDICALRLASTLGPVDVSGGPSYVATSVPVATSGATIIVSDGSKPHGDALHAPEGSGWEPHEWRALLDGTLGPWAMAEVSDQIVSICFSPRLTRVAAEAGVRTEPEHRGRGHAAAVTAAWASLVMATGRHAFYSTSADNMSSQRVAARLGLRPIGWIWQVGPPRA